jgi:hypothetical protein
MDLTYLTVAIAGILLVYHQLTTWLPLFPWNDVELYTRKQLLLEAITNGLMMGTGVICLAMGNIGFCHYYPLIYYPFLFLGEFIQWWIPYFSPSFAKARVNFDYDKLFARTIKLIPHQPGKRTPDGNHIVLHVLTLITILLVYLERLGQ